MIDERIPRPGFCAERGGDATRIAGGSFGIIQALPPNRSYRESHLDPLKVASFDRDLWDSRAAKGLEWILERRLLDGLLDDRPHVQRAIDFACGTGRLLGFLAARVPEVIGVDVSAAMIDIAHQRCPGARLVLGDVTTHPDLLTESRRGGNSVSLPAQRRAAVAFGRSRLDV